jgi:hypothetical protein
MISAIVLNLEFTNFRIAFQPFNPVKPFKKKTNQHASKVKQVGQRCNVSDRFTEIYTVVLTELATTSM